MIPVLDPRLGDIEDDALSTKRRSLFSLAGSLLAEVSLPKLVLAWILLVGLPCLTLGIAPLLISAWLSAISSKASAVLTGILPVFFVAALAGVGWFGGRKLFRMAESSFWTLNALAVQPGYVLFREGLRHLVGRVRPFSANTAHGPKIYAATAAGAGLAIGVAALFVIGLAWPSSRWVGSLMDFASPYEVMRIALANSAILISAYLAGASLLWGVADASMAQPRDLTVFAEDTRGGRHFRIAHLSDIHMVGERYGFRIESGRSGPRGNDRFRQTLAELRRLHNEDPLDVILITGDLTDAGRSAEWAEFFDALAPYPELAERMIALPGNHDVNVVDRANPARLDLPLSPKKRLRQIRNVAALARLQGSRVRIVNRNGMTLGTTLNEALEPRLADIAAFADLGSIRLSQKLGDLWDGIFPMVMTPATDNGMGVVILNSNAEAHFSFTNALGLVSVEQTHAMEAAIAAYPNAGWLVALHHHVVEYPQPAKALSERIGTALVNGSWFVRRLQRFAKRVVVMHGHRHVDWIGECGGLHILSAPSPVMEATNDMGTYFYIHTMRVSQAGVGLLKPHRVTMAGTPVTSPTDGIDPGLESL
ncbi:metallophosphoesterase family protein [Microvirga antarctica]|uniref:metallophosphoesterase family protein n=1 Tax=Microvirga antarctica TaxID=2819233 RepID=UPI001B303AEC|nr:metallophosphoesterase [Microvirga antarctica]